MQRAHSVDVYRSWLSTPGYHTWLVEIDPGGAPIGYMVMAPADLPLADLSSSDLELKRIYILSEFHRGGTGKRLVATAVQTAREQAAARLLLGVYAHNVTSIAFYERMGFKKLGDRRFSVGGTDYEDHIMGMTIEDGHLA